VIVGGDDVSYGAKAPEGTNWKARFLDEVKADLDLTRVHFTGRVSHPDLLTLFRITSAHAYLTYPFVLSWSLLEAMSCGALIIGSDTPPVAEVISDGVNGRLIGFFDVNAWSEALIDALANPKAQAPLKAAARQSVVDTYDLRRICLPKLVNFVTQSKDLT
jgi:glycosyltransferase involved in cell wall biosynthesis